MTDLPVPMRGAEGRRLRVRVAIAVVAAYALVSVVQVYAGVLALDGARRPLWAPALVVVPRIAFLALFTPVLLRLADRFRVVSPYRASRALLHAGVCMTLAAAYALVTDLSRRVLVGRSAYWEILVNRTDEVALYYIVILAVAYAVDHYEGARNREAERAELEARLATAQLQTLRMQIQPHFLFNTLNTVSALVGDDPAGADRMIRQLGDLLRRNMEHGSMQEVPLREELETVRLYLSIQEIRYQDWLRAEIRVDEEAQDALVPAFLLQPLVENAIRHGIAPAERTGRVRVSARRRGLRLVIRVRDDGVGVAPEPAAGTGLSTSAARLLHLYGPGNASLDLLPARGRGAVVRVVIPFRSAGAALQPA